MGGTADVLLWLPKPYFILHVSFASRSDLCLSSLKCLNTDMGRGEEGEELGTGRGKREIVINSDF